MPRVRKTVDRADAPPSALGSVEASGQARSNARTLAGGRVSIDTSALPLGKFPVLLAPPDAESDWQTYNLDSQALRKLPPYRLLELLCDLSPDISRSLWDWLRLCNPGYTVTALYPGSEQPYAAAQTKLQAFFDLLADRYGSLDVPINRLYTGAWLRGALMVELVLDLEGREMTDLATPDPATARFRRVGDPDLGVQWELGQWQWGEFVILDRPTIRYLPIDPFPGLPYGRPMASPALFSTLFLIQLLHDLAQVVSQQGYPRIDVILEADELRKVVSDDVQRDPKLWNETVGSLIEQVQTVLRGLRPGDFYVHTSAVQMGKPVGTVDASSLGSIGPLCELLERWAMRSLKTMPVLMGTNDGASEANANRQWEIMSAAVKAIQHHVEALLGRSLVMGLRAGGMAADVRWRFSELRASEMLRDSQTMALETINTIKHVLLGYISWEAGSQALLGHDPAPGAVRPPDELMVQLASQRPGGSGGGLGPAVAVANPEPGVNRAEDRNGSGVLDVQTLLDQATARFRSALEESA